MSRSLPHPQQRLTDTRLAQLKADLAAPHPPSQYVLARRYGVSQAFVSLVKNGHRRNKREAAA